MKICSYHELSELARKSLDVYPYLDSEHYLDYKYRVYTLSMDEAIKRIMSYEEMKESYSCFEEYHRDYACGFIPNHSFQYPVFHEPENDYEWLSDGWHRFHSYYKNGFKSVPVIEIIFTEKESRFGYEN